MSRKNDFLSLTRRRRVEPGRADDFGSERASSHNGEHYTLADCEVWLDWLRSRDFRSDVLVSVERVPWRPEILANSLDKLMRKFGQWWRRHYRVGPDGELGWLDYFIVTAPSEGDHASHGHIVLGAALTAADERMLEKLSAKQGLKVEVSGNRADWLEGKRGVGQHKCKLKYAIDHLLQAGSTYRIGGSEMPRWVQRTRRDFRRWRRERTRTAA